jgi:hypothetical protein
LDTPLTTTLFDTLDNNLLYNSRPAYFVRAVYLVGTEIRYSQVSMFRFPEVLPISLLSFRARNNGYSIDVDWTTATEINNMGFEVQRLMADGVNWEIIGFVEGNYNHNGLLKYSFNDYNPNNGVNYYRLRQIDFDGRFEFFGPVAVNFGTTETLVLKVMKTHRHTFVQIPVNEEGQIEVFDINGRLILSQFATGKVEIPNIRGTFIVRFNNGYEVATTKLVN